MNYNQPLQHLGFVASNSKDAIFLRSNVIILAKSGTTFSRRNVTDSALIPAEIRVTDPPPDFIITFQEVIDQSRTTDSYFSDIIDIVLLKNVSIDSTDNQDSIKKQIFTHFNNKSEFRVLVRVLCSGSPGEVTTTLTEKSDIEIV